MAPRKVESFSGGYVSVKGSELKKISPNNLLKALQVFDPSFRIVENNNVSRIGGWSSSIICSSAFCWASSRIRAACSLARNSSKYSAL